jgi:lysophospholipase L1-like esterase
MTPLENTMSENTAADSKRHKRSRSRRIVRGVVGTIVTLVLAALVATGCLVGALVVQGKAAPSGSSEYVALGSSFAAGPGLASQAAHSPTLCDRSSENYPHLVAKAKGLNLTDMTCSGAVSDDVLNGGQYFQGSQLAAVKRTTRLVTITIGGNDVFYLGNLFAWSCANQPGKVPATFKAAGICDVHTPAQVAAAFTSLAGNLTKIVDQIHTRAPGAQVVFVNYTTVLPATGSCAALPISDAQVDQARAVASRLRSITDSVATESGSTLVDAASLTAAHNLCSSDPWVYGFGFSSNPLGHSTLPFHPREAAMEAIAAAVEKAAH